jgi:hypothetical protein
MKRDRGHFEYTRLQGYDKGSSPVLVGAKMLHARIIDLTAIGGDERW